jgi:hypothetical protein
MEKPYLRCNKCNAVYHFPIRKNWITGGLLFFLPIKIYFCAKCAKNRYVWITDEKAAMFHRV